MVESKLTSPHEQDTGSPAMPHKNSDKIDRPENDVAIIDMSWHSSTDASVISTGGKFLGTVMEQTAYLSATDMSARKRRVLVFGMLFAWLAWLLTCPQVMHDTSNPVSAGEEHASHAVAGSTHDGSHDEACCTPAPHAAVAASVQKFDLTAYFVLTPVLPAIVAALTVLVVATTNRSFMRSSRLSWAKHSPLFWTLWPQAPPR